MKYLKLLAILSCTLLFTACMNKELSKEELAKQKQQKEELGRVLFFDNNLSKK